MNYFYQETVRLKMRKLTREDIPDWIPFFEQNSHLPYLGIDESLSKQKIARDWINAQLNRYSTQGFGHLAIICKSSGSFIGLGGILPREIDGQIEYEISYSLKPAYWGKGYATEIAKKMLQYAVENIDAKRFISIIHVDNTGSARVAKKNGMRVTSQSTFQGMKVDIYSIDKT